MVRINLIHPRHLADQHLLAEYYETLILLEYIRKYSKKIQKKYRTKNRAKKNDSSQNKKNIIPKNYCLGTGHMKFFRNKAGYLVKRHKEIKKEMIKRGFAPKKTASLKGIRKSLAKNWGPDSTAKKIIKKRLIQKIRKKPGFYRYYKKKYPLKFFVEMIRDA